MRKQKIFLFHKKRRHIIKFFIVGPCALESKEQMIPIVEMCKSWNIRYVRAQLFKPRTSPDSFQGLGKKGLHIIEYLKDNDLKLVSEACSEKQLDIIAQFASVIQIGARNMQNFELLKAIGQNTAYRQRKPYVMLKRGFSNTLDEWLSCAKYIIKSGVEPEKIILCERGSRNHAAPSGVTLDFGMALKARQKSDFKIIIDPSHGSGDSTLVLPLAKAAIALDFDGVMIEAHPYPKKSVSDAKQALSIKEVENFLIHLNASNHSEIGLETSTLCTS